MTGSLTIHYSDTPVPYVKHMLDGNGGQSVEIQSHVQWTGSAWRVMCMDEQPTPYAAKHLCIVVRTTGKDYVHALSRAVRLVESRMRELDLMRPTE